MKLVNSRSENAKMHENQQIPFAKRQKPAFCQNRRFAAGNVLKQICEIAELPQRQHRLRSTNAQKNPSQNPTVAYPTRRYYCCCCCCYYYYYYYYYYYFYY